MGKGHTQEERPRSQCTWPGYGTGPKGRTLRKPGRIRAGSHKWALGPSGQVDGETNGLCGLVGTTRRGPLIRCDFYGPSRASRGSRCQSRTYESYRPMDSISVVKLNRDGPLRSRIAAAAGGANPSAPPPLRRKPQEGIPSGIIPRRRRRRRRPRPRPRGRGRLLQRGGDRANLRLVSIEISTLRGGGSLGGFWSGVIEIGGAGSWEKERCFSVFGGYLAVEIL